METNYFKSAVCSERSRWYMGNLYTFLAKGEETGGLYSTMELLVRKGTDIPPHTHTKEDESFYIIDGEVLFYIDGKEVHAKPGDFVYCSRLLKHHFTLKTDTARIITTISPAGLEEVFWKASVPATSLSLRPLPAVPTPPDPEYLKSLRKMLEDKGLVFG